MAEQQDLTQEEALLTLFDKSCSQFQRDRIQPHVEHLNLLNERHSVLEDDWREQFHKDLTAVQRIVRSGIEEMLSQQNTALDIDALCNLIKDKCSIVNLRLKKGKQLKGNDTFNVFYASTELRKQMRAQFSELIAAINSERFIAFQNNVNKLLAAVFVEIYYDIDGNAADKLSALGSFLVKFREKFNAIVANDLDNQIDLDTLLSELDDWCQTPEPRELIQAFGTTLKFLSDQILDLILKVPEEGSDTLSELIEALQPDEPIQEVSASVEEPCEPEPVSPVVPTATVRTDESPIIKNLRQLLDGIDLGVIAYLEQQQSRRTFSAGIYKTVLAEVKSLLESESTGSINDKGAKTLYALLFLFSNKYYLLTKTLPDGTESVHLKARNSDTDPTAALSKLLLRFISEPGQRNNQLQLFQYVLDELQLSVCEYNERLACVETRRIEIISESLKRRTPLRDEIADSTSETDEVVPLDGRIAKLNALQAQIIANRAAVEAQIINLNTHLAPILEQLTQLQRSQIITDQRSKINQITL